jgi:hypothetical protein
MVLITATEAKTYLRIVGADFDGELALKVPQASAIVLDWITVDEEDLVDEDLDVAKAAAFEVTRRLVEGTDPLSNDVKNVLRRFRDPSLA